MLLFKKSEMLKYKVPVTNMPHPVLECRSYPVLGHAYPVLEHPILF